MKQREIDFRNETRTGRAHLRAKHVGQRFHLPEASREWAVRYYPMDSNVSATTVCLATATARKN
jgi:hypothetical protein